MLKPFFIWKDKKLISLNPADVMFLKTIGNYTNIILSNETYFMVHASLSSTLKKLPPDLFIKTHRSWAASIFYIDTIERDHLNIGENVIPIARQYYKSVLGQLNVII
jgi:DNA-binding LytR/AlgR family response regulator